MTLRPETAAELRHERQPLSHDEVMAARAYRVPLPAYAGPVDGQWARREIEQARRNWANFQELMGGRR